MTSAVFVLEVDPPDRSGDSSDFHLLVEREENVNFDSEHGNLISAEISLRYWIIGDGAVRGFGADGRFDGKLSFFSRTVSLTGGGVFLDPESLRGKKVGTFLMNEIVQWAKGWPSCNVNQITLNADLGTSENKERRNKFYEQFGIEFDYSDPEQKGGVSKPMMTDALCIVESWKQNIRVHDLRNYLETTIEAKKRAELDAKLLQTQNENLRSDRKEAETRPFRWALDILWYRYFRNGLIYAICGLVLLGALYWNSV